MDEALKRKSARVVRRRRSGRFAAAGNEAERRKQIIIIVVIVLFVNEELLFENGKKSLNAEKSTVSARRKLLTLVLFLLGLQLCLVRSAERRMREKNARNAICSLLTYERTCASPMSGSRTFRCEKRSLQISAPLTN